MIGPLIGAGVSLLGNVLGMNASSKEAEAARNQQMFMNQQNIDLQREFWEKNAALQREFAQSGIRWRTEDAKAAGLHPLFALSGGGAAFSPTPYQAGDTSPVRDNSSQYLSAMGQDIGRALSATQTKTERANDTLTALQLKRADLENQLLSAQIAKLTGQIGPPIPEATAGESVLGPAKISPVEINAAFPGKPQFTAGQAQPYTQFVHTGSGLLGMPNKDVGGLDDVDLANPYGLEHIVRNRLSPMLGSKNAKPPMELVRKYWPNATGVKWSRLSMEWKPVYGDYKTDRPWPYNVPNHAAGGDYSGGDGFSYVAP